jgi:O-methyltransferase
MKKIIKSILKRFGIIAYRIPKHTSVTKLSYSTFTNSVIEKVRPYTMTTDERIAALITAVDYIEKNQIEGDFVECGVWKGGSAVAMIECLKQHNSHNRYLYLYDTFEGMSSPTENDKDFTGRDALEYLKENEKNTGNAMWCYAPLELVKNVVSDKGYPNEKIKFIKGKVEETIPQIMPQKIALLRLDTDFYESTKHEMEFLFPLLVSGGVLIIDDYGYWKGSRKAVDEYIDKNKIKILLNDIDKQGRIAVKL